MADSQKVKAVESAQEFVKYLVVLGVGALGFALSMLRPVPLHFILTTFLLVIACLLLALSVFLGILAHGTLVSQLYNDEINLEAPRLAVQAQGQWILFFLGVIVLAAAVFARSVL